MPDRTDGILANKVLVGTEAALPRITQWALLAAPSASVRRIRQQHQDIKMKCAPTLAYLLESHQLMNLKHLLNAGKLLPPHTPERGETFFSLAGAEWS
jgi:hypothetical protein